MCCTGEVRLHQEARFQTQGSVYGLHMMRGGLLSACGGDSRASWAAVFDQSGQTQANLQLPRGCRPLGMYELNNHMVLTDGVNNCLQVCQPLHHAGFLSL